MFSTAAIKSDFVKKRLARQEGELDSTFLYRYALLTGVVPERATGGHCGPRDL